MSSRKLVALGLFSLVIGAGSLVGTVTADAAYETAEYKVVEKDGKIEIRQYPALVLVSTSTKPDTNGRDGSFMRLFRYISGDNEGGTKIAMTTPVFMGDGRTSGGKGTSGKAGGDLMGFVVPRDVVDGGTPTPKSSQVQIRRRPAGRYAVIRFSGRLSEKLAKENESKLRSWMKAKGIGGAEAAESASYNSPITPGPLRRNEVLVRIPEPRS